MAYYIEQAGGAGTGGDDESLEDCWIGLPVTINVPAEAGSTYLHVLLDRAGTETATLADETTATATITPTVTGTLRVRSTAYRADGTTEVWTRVIRTTQNAAGADADNGICPTAFGELAGESNAGGNARGYIARHERNWRAAATISGGGGSGTEAPTASTVVQRTSAGVGRFVGLTLETDTDGDRKIAAYAADGTTAATLAIVAETVSVTADSEVDITGPSGVIVSSSGACEVHAGTHSRSDASGNFAWSEVPAAARTIAYPATTTSLADTITQAASGAGGTRTTRGQQGAAGSVGGDLVDGPGDGGTPGTNAPGNRRIKLGTPVSNISGKFVLELEDGTAILYAYRQSATTTLLSTGVNTDSLTLGGSLGASGNSLTIVPNSYINFFVPSGYMLINAGTNIPLFLGADTIVSGKSNAERREIIKQATVTTATTTVLASWATTAGKTFRVSGYVIIQNDTDTLSMMAEVTTAGLYRNVGGVITTIQAAVMTAVGDASETSNVTVSITFSGATVQLQAVTANAKTRKMTAELVNRVTI